MVDLTQIYVKAGDGGDGAAAFTTDKYHPKGPPCGGDGGKGGDVVLIANESVHTLLDFHFKSSFKAQSGKRGAENHKKGLSGKDLVLKVPVGTMVHGVGELVSAGQMLVVASGGRGGRGNAHLKVSALGKVSAEELYQALQQAEKGVEGEERTLSLELKLIADVGIIGLPNAGKSTLLSVLTAARPKIADYPFTTIEPNLGVMQAGDTSLTLADIPGLIEGSSKGRGLGLEFLRHVERTFLLVHLISAEAEVVNAAYQLVRHEISTYSNNLLKKEEIIVLSKIDILSTAERQQKELELKRLKKDYLLISSATGEGIETMRETLLDRVISSGKHGKIEGSDGNNLSS